MVRAGRADLGAVGARVFDTLGDKAFTPLLAPMLIDSLEVERRVLASDAVVPMLDSVRSLGVQGAALVAGALRRPLAKRPLLGPGEWSGARIAVTGRRADRPQRRGARCAPASYQGRADLGPVDGIEMSLASISGNGYHRDARHLTGNVVLWPRPLVVVAAPGVTPAQLDVLRRAARSALPAELDVTRAMETDRLPVMCRQGLQVSQASRRPTWPRSATRSGRSTTRSPPYPATDAATTGRSRRPPRRSARRPTRSVATRPTHDRARTRSRTAPTR